MIRRPPRSTRTDTLFPYTTLFRSQRTKLLPGLADGSSRAAVAQPGDMPIRLDGGSVGATIPDMIGAPAATLLFLRGERAGRPCWLALPADAPGVSIAATALTDAKIGRAHV